MEKQQQPNNKLYTNHGMVEKKYVYKQINFEKVQNIKI